MSMKHPVIAVTGSSGAVTPEVRTAFEHILFRASATAAWVQGDAFHCHDRADMREKMKSEEKAGNLNYSHFRPEANCIDRLEYLFDNYGRNGSGRHRYYMHSDTDAKRHSAHFGIDLRPGEITPWEDIPESTDILLYQGLHGMLKTQENDVSQHVDLGIGIVPIINLEWIQKSHRDKAQRGYRQYEVITSILRRMPDFIHYITPQFSRTDINFQRVPCVDTSNPFINRDIPTLDESLVVIRFRKPETFDIDFPFLLDKIENSFMSRRNTIVVPGSKMTYAMELILEPIISSLLEKRQTG
ncbi:MAG: phosphoribulokinase [bacterium]|nr:phosphoribulokinase [bacterium]